MDQQEPSGGDGTELLNEQECQKLVLALAEGSGETGFTEEDLQKVSDWAIETRVNQVMLDGILKGLFAVRVKDGEVMFSASETGKKVYAKYREYKHKLN